MRELDLFLRLRKLGLEISYHIFADVLLRADFWMKNELICVYFEKSAFIERKQPTADFFNDPKHVFRIHHVLIQKQNFGKFWIAENAVEKLAVDLSKC